MKLLKIYFSKTFIVCCLLTLSLISSNIRKIKKSKQTMNTFVQAATEQFGRLLPISRTEIFQVQLNTNTYKGQDHHTLALCVQSLPSDEVHFFIAERDPDKSVMLLSYITKFRFTNLENRCEGGHGWDLAKGATRFYDRNPEDDRRYNEAVENVRRVVGRSVTSVVTNEVKYWFGQALFAIGDVLTFGALTPIHFLYSAAQGANVAANIVNFTKTTQQIWDSIPDSDKSKINVTKNSEKSALATSNGMKFDIFLKMMGCYTESIKLITGKAKSFPLQYYEYYQDVQQAMVLKPEDKTIS